MYDQTTIQQIRESVKGWEVTDVQKAAAHIPEHHDPFTTISGAEVTGSTPPPTSPTSTTTVI